VAGLVAQTATYPLHVVRRRMQVQGRDAVGRYEGEGFVGLGAAMRRIYLEEGVRNGLFKGVSVTWLKVGHGRCSHFPAGRSAFY
jgi:solute carrier family 25 protein 42